MAASVAQKHIVVVGAGVFGLSSALHLLDEGHTVTLIDRQPYHVNEYDSLNGDADAASCDLNKIFRASYGWDALLNDLALQAHRVWLEWATLTQPDPIFESVGYLRLDDHDTHQAKEQGALDCFTKQGLRSTQYDIRDAHDRERAEADGLLPRLDPLGRDARNLKTIGVYDTTGGFVHASRACFYVLKQLMLRPGFRCLLGPEHALVRTISEPGSAGVETANGEHVMGDLVVLAMGPWSMQALPELCDRVEATAGNVAVLQIPHERKDLLDKYSPLNMPVVAWKSGHGLEQEPGGGIYFFPTTRDGMIKIGHRGVKWTNPGPQEPLRKSESPTFVSRPVTAATVPSETRLPQSALQDIKAFCRVNMPDIVEAGGYIAKTRLCWYTDVIDNMFIIDHVPGRPGIICCTGGSGHGFKFLPVLGHVTADVVAGRGGPLRERFRWRSREEMEQARENTINEGLDGPCVLYKQRMAEPGDMDFGGEANGAH